MSVIKVKIVNEKISILKKDTTDPITSGNIGTVGIEFEFSEEWEGFTKTAVLYSNNYDKETASNILLNENDKIEEDNLPSELISQDCVLYIGVIGINTNNQRITTDVVGYTIKKGVPVSSVDSVVPANVYNQIIKIMLDTKDIAQSVRNDADNGGFSYMITEKDYDEIAHKTYEKSNTELSNLITAGIESINAETDKQIENIQELLKMVTVMEVKVVEELPTVDISNKTIYFVRRDDGKENDIYDEYMFINEEWELIGSTDIDLSGYVPKTRKFAGFSLASDVELKSFAYSLANDSYFISYLNQNSTFASAFAYNSTFASTFAYNSIFAKALASYSTLWENLANNSSFAGRIASNTGFASIMNMELKYRSEYGALVKNKTFTQMLASESAFIQYLGSNSTFGSALGYNSMFVQTLTSNSTFVSAFAHNSIFASAFAYNSTFASAFASLFAYNSIFASAFAHNRSFIIDFANYIPSVVGMFIPTPSQGDSGKVLMANGYGNVSWVTV